MEELPKYDPGKTSLDTIVGKEKLAVELITASYKAIIYEAEEKSNPFEYSGEAYLLFGEKGSGKNMIIDAVCNYARSFAVRLDKELGLVDMTSSTAQQMDQCFERMREGDKVYIAVLGNLDEKRLHRNSGLSESLKRNLDSENLGNYIVLAASHDIRCVPDDIVDRFYTVNVEFPFFPNVIPAKPGPEVIRAIDLPVRFNIPINTDPDIGRKFQEAVKELEERRKTEGRLDDKPLFSASDVPSIPRLREELKRVLEYNPEHGPRISIKEMMEKTASGEIEVKRSSTRTVIATSNAPSNDYVKDPRLRELFKRHLKGK